MRKLDNRQNKGQQIRVKVKKRWDIPKKPPGSKIGYHKKGPSRYPSM